MSSKFLQHALRCAVASVAVLVSTTSFAAFATVADWTADNNAPPDPEAESNNYNISPPDTAGGTFQTRRTRPLATSPINTAFLSDPTLVGSPVGSPTGFGFNEDFSAMGTLTFTNPNAVDPNIFFGFYASAGTTAANTQRLGLAFADSGVNLFRVQGTARGSTSLTVTNTLTTTGAAPSPANGPTAQAPAGTYNFAFSYVAATRAFNASISDGTTTFFRNVILAAGFASADPDALNRFGFLQFGDQVVAVPPASQFLPFTLSVTGINYSGETQIPEPTSLTLAVLCLAMSARLRKRS